MLHSCLCISDPKCGGGTPNWKETRSEAVILLMLEDLFRERDTQVW